MLRQATKSSGPYLKACIKNCPCRGRIITPIGGIELCAPYRGNALCSNINVGVNPYAILCAPYRGMGKCGVLYVCKWSFVCKRVARMSANGVSSANVSPVCLQMEFRLQTCRPYVCKCRIVCHRENRILRIVSLAGRNPQIVCPVPFFYSGRMLTANPPAAASLIFSMVLAVTFLRVMVYACGLVL